MPKILLLIQRIEEYNPELLKYINIKAKTKRKRKNTTKKGNI
jgi:hypothetical protein